MSERSTNPSLASPTRPANELHVAGEPWYRRESWLAVCFSAFIPIVPALLLPGSLRTVLLGIGVAIAVVGLAMLVRKELQRMKHGDTTLEP